MPIQVFPFLLSYPSHCLICTFYSISFHFLFKFDFYNRNISRFLPPFTSLFLCTDQFDINTTHDSDISLMLSLFKNLCQWLFSALVCGKYKTLRINMSSIALLYDWEFLRLYLSGGSNTHVSQFPALLFRSIFPPLIL